MILEGSINQKGLADHLGWTAASQFDLERGKVQVTASDLYKISKYLRKPIEYFFGENFSGEQIQDLVSVLRSQARAAREANIEYIKKMIKLQHIGDEITNLPIDEIPVEKMKEFLDLLVDITNKNKNASKQVEDATKLVLTGIEFKGIDFSEYLLKLNSI